MFGGGNGVAARGVHDDDAVFGGGFDIDVIDANASAADGFQVFGGFEDFGGDFGLAADDEGGNALEGFDELIFFETGFDNDFEETARSEFIDTALRNGISDKDTKVSHKERRG